MGNESLEPVAEMLQLQLRGKDHEAKFKELAAAVNELLVNDFQRLVGILYRVDVSETLLRLKLKENPGMDAGAIIAGLMVERHAEKIRSRKQHGTGKTWLDD